ncbi:MAG: sel1 repeat family protein [Prevotella sp.]|nr:sel1 repeat family protein [Prevotella sp.]MBR4651142.1 sel1 repeat family protein [Prevotella sp.]
MEETKKCPYCGGEILNIAKKCKHCGKWIEPKANESHKENRQENGGKKLLYFIICLGIIALGVYFTLFSGNGMLEDVKVNEDPEIRFAEPETNYTANKWDDNKQPESLAPNTEIIEENFVSDEFLSYKQAADNGDPVAQNKVGNMYAQGIGCTKDMQKAFTYYRLSAMQGNKYAQHNLGFCYWDGTGVEKNRDEGLKWLRLAAEQGYDKSIKFLKNIGEY